MTDQNTSLDLQSRKLYNIAAVIMVKNEAPYIKEWVDYHILLGIDHFYIHDNESTDNTVEVLEPYIKQGLVSLDVVKGDFNFNSACEGWRMRCVNKYRAQADWMVFLDADEFLRLTNEDTSLLNILQTCTDRDIFSFHLNVLNFGTNWKKEEKLFIPVTYRFVRRYQTSQTVKPIAKSEIIEGMVNGHVIKIKPGFKASVTLGTNRTAPYNAAQTGPEDPLSISTILDSEPLVINHYFTKSVQEYTTRKNKYKKCNIAPTHYNIKFLNFHAQRMNHTLDDSLQRFAPLLAGPIDILDLLPVISEYWNPVEIMPPYIDLLYETEKTIKAYIKKHDPDGARYKKWKNIDTSEGGSEPVHPMGRRNLVTFAQFLMSPTSTMLSPPTLTGLLEILNKHLRCKTCKQIAPLNPDFFEADTLRKPKQK